MDSYFRNTSSMVVADTPKLPIPSCVPFSSYSVNKASNLIDSSVGRSTVSSAPTCDSTDAEGAWLLMTSINDNTSQYGSFTIIKW